MLVEKNKSCVLLVDVQQKLTPLVLNNRNLVNSCAWLLSLAQDLDIPTMITEQYPRGLGTTIGTLTENLQELIKIPKVTFSVCADDKCMDQLSAINKDQIIVMGIETSVCILQTVLDLLQKNKQVYVVVDAVSARHQLDHDLALERMKIAGAQLITKEMVMFEWLRTAEHAMFKELSKKYLISQ